MLFLVRGDVDFVFEVCSSPHCQSKAHTAMVLWEAFYIENKRFDLDTPRVPSRSPTPISKSNDFRGQSDDIWEARGTHFWPILGDSRGPGRLKEYICVTDLDSGPDFIF